jgi:hypothetical protein
MQSGAMDDQTAVRGRSISGIHNRLMAMHRFDRIAELIRLDLR